MPFHHRSEPVSRWDERDLEERLCRALDIARKTVLAFGLDGYTDTETPAYSFGAEKPLAETSMLMYASESFRHRRQIRQRLDGLAELVAPRARSERVMANIALNPALAFKFAAPHVLLTRLGYGDPVFDRLLDSSLASEAADGHDRPPSARLERKWLTAVWTGEDSGADWSSDLAGSVLDTPLDILGGRREDVYAWTHLVMYATDFGNQPRRLTRADTRMSDATSLLARYLDSEDYDLAGELLLAFPLTASAWTPAAAFAFRVLASVEDQVRVLPCGNLNVARLNALEGEDRFRYALGTAYHTAYVMGFLCAASMRPDRTPPRQIVGRRWQACLKEILAHVDHEQGHWQDEFAWLPDDERQVLTPFVLDMALVQRCRTRDYAAVHTLLSIASRHDLPVSPLCRQAADLLARMASCSTAVAAKRSSPQQGSFAACD